jgi:hypothetical protein
VGNECTRSADFGNGKEILEFNQRKTPVTIPAKFDENSPESVAISLTGVTDLAIEVWRLERWLMEAPSGQSTAAVRYATRRIGALLHQLGMETIDITGQPYDPGLAIEIIGSNQDPALPPGVVVVDEMVTPLCLWRGKVVRHGQAVTRSSPIKSTI